MPLRSAKLCCSAACSGWIAVARGACTAHQKAHVSTGSQADGELSGAAGKLKFQVKVGGEGFSI